MKDVWKSARVEVGARCVMISGILLMPVWPADSWDSQASVCYSSVQQLILYIHFSLRCRASGTIINKSQLISWYYLLLQMLLLFHYLPLAKGLAPSIWMMCSVLELKVDQWTVYTHQFITASTLKMLVCAANDNVSSRDCETREALQVQSSISNYHCIYIGLLIYSGNKTFVFILFAHRYLQ